MNIARLQVRVQPRAKSNRVEVADEGRVKVYVTVAPEGGQANDAVVGLLAKKLGLAKSSIQVQRGHKQRNKFLVIEGLTAAELMERLDAG